MYKGEADWTLIGKVKNNPRIQIPIFGNGDINILQVMHPCTIHFYFIRGRCFN